MPLVVLEGPDGAGKSRLQRALGDHLVRRGVQPLELREPGSTPVGERLRQVLLDPAVGHLDPLTEALLFSAARAEMVRAVLRPALAAGRCVLLDRWFWSTLAYQGGGGGVPLELIERISAMATAGVRPDLVLLLDLDPGAGAARKRAKDRMEDRGAEFARRVRATYLELARRESAVTRIIDASRPFEAVFEDALRFVGGIVPPRGAPS